VDEHSDHLTIGLKAVTWDRALRSAIDAEVAAGRLTASVPAGTLDVDRRVVAPCVGLDGLRDRLAPDVLRHWMAHEVWRGQPPTRLRPRLAPALGAAPLRLTPGPLLWLTTVGDRAVLGLGDRSLDMPCEGLGFLADLLRREDAFAAEDVRGLDEGSRTVVLRRMLAEGVLRHADG
jgi:hypothetical protein